MSLAAAEPGLQPEAAFPEPPSNGVAPPGLALSAALHLGLGVVLVLGLPRLFSPPQPQDMPIAVELVNIGPETRATHPNPNPPQPKAKPDIPVPQPSETKPEPKPLPPKPAPPPPSAEAPPPAPAPPAPPEAKPEAAPPPPPPPEPKPTPPPPPPKPVEKVEAPRPKEKPAPPQLAKNDAPERKKYDPRRFESLLKNLAASDTAPSPDAPPQERMAVATGAPSSQPKAPLGSRLSASEEDMVREQISRCWNVPAGARDAKDLVVEIRVVVGPDGNVRQATIVDQGRAASDPFYRAAAESARRAFFNPACRPLRLPPDKYAIWKDMVVDFSPKDIL
jgi:outer membrane biosynthesis protein TonB